MTREVGILIFDDVEVLDFAGPYEVFSVAGRRSGIEPFRVRLIAREQRVVIARNDFRVTPHTDFESHEPLHVLVLPGGAGTRRLLGDEATRAWIRSRDAAAEMTLSVCTGSLLLADAGLLSELEATTHASAYDELRRIDPGVSVREGVRWVDNGRLITSAGVSSGIEASLHVVARLCGAEVATEAADYIEYPWEPGAG